MLAKLREINNKMIEGFKKRGDEQALLKHKAIAGVLAHDDCFERLSFEEAFTILKSLKIKEWKEVYALLLSK